MSKEVFKDGVSVGILGETGCCREAFSVKDSGKRQDFDTGARRDVQDDKPRYDLIPPLALKRVAELYNKGLFKYGEDNWSKGIPIRRCYASMMRHAFQFGAGETDEDHLAAVCFNALCIMHFQEIGREDLNDMPDWKSKGQPKNANG